MGLSSVLSFLLPKKSSKEKDDATDNNVYDEDESIQIGRVEVVDMFETNLDENAANRD